MAWVLSSWVETGWVIELVILLREVQVGAGLSEFQLEAALVEYSLEANQSEHSYAAS